MAKVFSDEIKALPVDMRYILLDDLVTAFESRLSIFTQPKARPLQEDYEIVVGNQEVVA